MKGFLIALQFLTIVPVNPALKIEKEDFGRALAWFPFVGALIGGVLSLVVFLLPILPQLVIASFIIAGSIFITAGIHLDGFADTCDGLYGFSTKERALEIMRDSHIGSMASVCITLLLIFKLSLLASLPKETLWRYIVLTTAFARWAQVVSCFFSKYCRAQGKAKFFIEYANLSGLIVSGIFTLALFIWLLKAQGVILFFACLAAIIIPLNYIKAKLEGMSGDTVGAISELAEITVFLFGLIYSRLYL